MPILAAGSSSQQRQPGSTGGLGDFQTLPIIPQAQFETQPQTQSQQFNAVSYFAAADSHNIANSNKTFLESLGSDIADIPKFIAASLVSGVNQLYNIAPSIGNALGGDFDMSDTGEVMAAIDDDLGQYYQEHEQGVDVLGFILSSAVPGLGGIKILNAGQKAMTSAMATGKMGNGMTKAFGLLTPKRADNLKNAVNSVVNSDRRFSLTEKNLLKAMGSGVHQGVLEAAAFETMVAATMFDSPVLEGQDLGDLAHNIAFGGLVFGAIGGTIDAARSVYTVKSALKAADKEARPWNAIMKPAEGATPSDKLIHYSDQIAAIPPVPTTLDPARIALLEGAAKKKREELAGFMREEFTAIADGDHVVAQQLFDEAKLIDNPTLLGNYMGSKSVSRLADKTTVEKKHIAMAAKLQTDKGRAKVSIEDAETHVNTEFTYTKNYGENAGNVGVDRPVSTQIVDLLKKGEVIKISDNKISAGKESWKFDPVSKHPELEKWDISHSSVMEANARTIWLTKQPPLPKNKEIYFKDTPLLEQAYKQFDEFGTTFKVGMEDGSKRSFASKNELLDFIGKQKESLVNEIHTNSTKGIFYASEDAMIDKLRELTGLHLISARGNAIGRNTIGDFVTTTEGTARIRLNTAFLTKLPLHDLLNTVKHEQGHSIFDVLLRVGGIPASKRAGVRAEMEVLSRLQRPKHWAHADATGDYSYLRYTNRPAFQESASHELAADAFAYLSKFPKEAAKKAPEFNALFGHLLHPLGKDVVAKYVKKSHQLTQDEIAAMLNMRSSRLNGEVRANPADDLLAMDSYAAEYSKRMRDGGAMKADAPDVELWKIPQHTKMMTDTTAVKDIDGNVLAGMAIIKQREREYVANIDRAFESVIGKVEAGKFDSISSQELETINRMGAERAFLTSASANYGTIAAKFAFIGSITSKLKHAKAAEIDEIMQPLLYKLTQKPAAAIEWSTLNAKIRSIPEQYTLNEAGDALVLAKMARYEEKVKAATAAGEDTSKIKVPEFGAGTVPEFKLASEEVRELAQLHIQQNGRYRKDVQTIRAAQGVQHRANSDVFYPIPVNQRDFPFFATVTDNNIVGHGATKTLYAHTEEQLTAMIKKLDNEPGLEIRTKGEAEKFWKRIGQFDYEKTIHDNQLDTLLNRKGVSSPYYVATDPDKIASELLSWHKERGVGSVMEAVSAKYELPFSHLKAMGDAYTNVATSRAGNLSLTKHADEVVRNPYMDLVKTALDIKNHQDYPFWIAANRLLDNKFTQMFSSMTKSAEGSKSLEDLQEINKTMRDNGYKGASYDAEMDLLANHTAPRGALTAFIQQSNALLATTTLRLDWLNAVNNTVGANVLLGAETKAVIRAIERGDAEAVGALADIAKVLVPGTDKQMLSAKKLIANSIKKFGRDTPEMQFYKDHNFVTSISDQYKWTLDQLTLEGKETIKDLTSKTERVRANLVKAADTGERWTGNRLAEEFNRFVAADVMKQLTDIAVTRGLMGEKQALSYINTFVNRTQGNYLASQRPMLFQGPIGQAVGLFQTYQFNLMQQLLRHVGEGKAKDAMTLLGLQGTIYGMNGLPAFNAINTHVIGTASGNKEHTDAYDVLYGSVGKQAADWLMYGVASNMLLDPDAKVNLYTRGDINPRHVTIIPTNPADLPIYGAYTKFFGNLFNTADQLMSGGDVSNTLLQGLEHNGISRPLAGLAQTLEGLGNPSHSSYSTSNQGNVVAANDLMSLANMARLVGGKPLAEAVATDAAFRLRAYAAKDAKAKKELSKDIKSTLIAGGTPSQEQINNFAESYVGLGGKQENFNKWTLQLYKTANQGQANALMNGLNSAESKSMQRLMGGTELGDFANRDITGGDLEEGGF